MSPLDDYEQQQLALIRAWRSQQPGFATRSIGKATGPISTAAEKLVPTLALRLTLDAVHATAVRLSDRSSILKRAGVAQIEDLRGAELQACDRLAARVGRRAIWLGGGSGAVFGVVGVFGLVADLPTLLTLTFRTIHRLGLCYGEDLAAPERRGLPVAVFALAAANTMEEKQEALNAIDALGDAADSSAAIDGINRAAQRELAKDSVAFSLNTLGQRLGWRIAGESLPVVGALVSGSVNAWYLRELARCAQYTFQLRWLRQRYGHQHALPGSDQASV
jgi:hypothetical protein